MSDVPSVVTETVRPGHNMEMTSQNEQNGIAAYTCSACDRTAYHDSIQNRVIGPAVIEECFS